MPTKTRIIIVSILILLGGALIFYCLFSYPTESITQAEGTSNAVAGLEAASVEATSMGDEEQDQSVQNNQTRSQGRSRPRSGAT
jgi:hypothetical protein